MPRMERFPNNLGFDDADYQAWCQRVWSDKTTKERNLIMTTHTPGPWKTDATGRTHGFSVTDAAGRSIAVYASNGKRDPVEQLGNALLIVAAPAMREALKDCLNTALAGTNGRNITHETRLKEVAVIVQAALALADGNGVVRP